MPLESVGDIAYYGSPEIEDVTSSWLQNPFSHEEAVKFTYLHSPDYSDDIASYYSDSEGFVETSDSDVTIADNDHTHGSPDFVGPDGKPLIIEGASLALAPDGMPISFPCFTMEEDSIHADFPTTSGILSAFL